ncbi:MAG: NADH:flavin oxidoreductase [Clostridiaceae bacterium]
MNYLNKSLENKKIYLHNRLVMPPMATSKSQENGKISKNLLNYYDEKTKGGYIGLVIIEHSYITKQGKAHEKQLSIADNADLEGLEQLANIIHKNGSKTIMQINHAGSAANKEVTGCAVVGPSAAKNPRRGNIPNELEKGDIKNIIEEFKNAVLRVKQAGFDGVEIHSAHGYLLNQFLSPLSNKRQDEYGGDLLSRIKIHIDIIKVVRQAVGEDFPIFLRLGACDYMDGGTTIEDSKIAAKEFEKAGLDILDISGGFSGYSINSNNEQGYFSPLTKAIKEVISIPVILTGGITEASACENLLEEEKADLIGVGRAIYKDSNWAKNTMESLK